jgi:hypothetical protein
MGKCMKSVWSEVLPAVAMKNTIFWVVTLCNSERTQISGGTHRPYLQGLSELQSSTVQTTVLCNMNYSLYKLKAQRNYIRKHFSSERGIRWRVSRDDEAQPYSPLTSLREAGLWDDHAVRVCARLSYSVPTPISTIEQSDWFSQILHCW